MKTYYELVQEKKREQSDLDKRMAADADLLYLIHYVTRDIDGKAVPGIINITLNRPAVFGANVVASIGNARQQVVVESEDLKIDTKLIEDFLTAAHQSADRRLWLAGQPMLNPFADAQLCFRGRTARRVLLREENGETISDIQPWDGRYTYQINGENGPAYGYETWRTKEDIETELRDKYNVAFPLPAGGGSGNTVARSRGNEITYPVLDVWDKEVNEVWVSGQKVIEQEHKLDVCPVVMQVVSLGYGPMLLDPNWGKHEGESIFFMIRDIVPELNRLASILQTLNMTQIKVALQYKNPEGSPQDEPPERPEIGDIVSTGKGELTPINLGDAKSAAQMMYNIMEKAFQEGSYTDIDVGNVQQPFSAVALVTIGENKDMVYMPRLAAKEMLNVATAEMLIKQAEQIGGTIELGIPGHKRSFPVSKLTGEYSIDYKYFVKSPKIDIARMSLAEAAAKWYPREYIYKEVLQVEDPEGLLREWHSQEAEDLSPGVKQHRIIMDLLERAEKNNDEAAAREAQIMALELGLTLDQIRAGQMEAGGPIVPEQAEPMLPLLGEGNKVGGLSPNKMAANLQKMPKQETVLKGG